MSKPAAYHHLEVRPGLGKTSLIVVVGMDRSETVLDAGLTGAQARLRVRELAMTMRLPIADKTTPRVEDRWLGQRRTGI